jgi:hypothetical protein
MGVISLILLVFSFVCFVIAGLWSPPQPPRVNFGWLGLAFWVLSLILSNTLK